MFTKPHKRFFRVNKALLFFLILFGTTASAQTNLYIDSSASTGGSGTTWATAFNTLSQALSIANSGTGKYILHIAAGTYYATGQQSSTARDSAFLIQRSGIQLWGGYPSGGGTRNTSTNPTILAGNIGSASSDTDNSYHILVAANIPASADSIVVDGLSFTGGKGNGATTRIYNGTSANSNSGGAVYNTRVRATMLIRNCRFYGNSASLLGGAVYADSTMPYIISSEFFSNNANDGGAVASCNAVQPAAISNCSFWNNTASRYGGALYIRDYFAAVGDIVQRRRLTVARS